MIEQKSGKSFPIYCVQVAGELPTHAVGTVVLMMDDDAWLFEHLCPASYATKPDHCLAVSSMLKNQTSDTLQKAAVYGVINGVQLADVSTNMVYEITTNADILVSSAPCILGKIIISGSVSGGEIKLYDDNSLPCDSNYIGTIITDNRIIFDFNHTCSNGLCVNTNGTANVYASILYRVNP